jgi:hypothetical protein
VRVLKERATLFRKVSQLKTCRSVYGGLGGRFFGWALLAGTLLAPGWAAQAQPATEASVASELDGTPPEPASETPEGEPPAAAGVTAPVEAAASASPPEATSDAGLPSETTSRSDAPAQLPPEPLPASPLPPLPALIQPQAGSEAIVDALEAWRRKDRQRLAGARAATIASGHPLAMWVDYWALSSRLTDATQTEVDAFYARWADTYVEDRLRNDWLLELGLRRDWSGFAANFPRFRMNDDREVTCYAQYTQHLAGQDVHEAARAAWFAQRDADEGCAFMASALVQAKVLTRADVWRKVRLALDGNRPRAARLAAALAGPGPAAAMQEIFDNPARFLAARARVPATMRSSRPPRSCAWPPPIPQWPHWRYGIAGSARCRLTWRGGPGPAWASRPH